MATRLAFQTVIQRLLDLCRQWARQSLSSLPYLIRHIVKDDGHHSELEDGPSRIGTIGTRSTTPGTLCGPRGDETGYPICSSSPGIPPKAYTLQHFNPSDYIESVQRSPTLPNSLGIIPDDDDGRWRSMAALEEGQILSGTRLVAEPSHMTANPQAEGTSLSCTTPSLRPRYDRNIEIKSLAESKEWLFLPFGTFDVGKEKGVHLWKSYTHPEGQNYHSKERNGLVYLTEANLDEVDIQEDIESAMTKIEQTFEFNKSMSSEIEVLLEHTSEGWSYYMMDLNERRIFWLDDFDAAQLIPGKFGIEKRDHFRHLLDYEYWMHVEHFPGHRKLGKGVLEELLGILNHGNIDFMTSSESTFPYNTSETHSLIGSVKHLQSLYEANESMEYVTAGAARIMGIFANERFYNFYGHHGVRLGVGQSVRGGVTKQRSWLIKLLSPALFYAPETHLVMLEKLYVDEMIKALRWRPFQSKLQDDWDAFVLTSTVLLSANVAFLAVPSVQAVVGPDQELWTSVATVPSLVSIVTSLGSIIIGLLLKRQLRISTKDAECSAADAVTYLQKRKHPQLGLETMAIQYSLPYALLMWSMTAFFVSVVIVCFLNVNDTATTFARVVYGSVWMFVVVLILWTIFTGLETTTSISWRDFNLPLWRKADSGAGSDAGENEKVEARDSDARSQHSSRGSTLTSATRQTHSWRRNPMRGFTFVTGKRTHKAHP
ncbi:hypothetical protein M0805_003188 [Coniferiporia weirii]|nr:hypothetical protein M0805_003188 [Coniferiporia weirii]